MYAPSLGGALTSSWDLSIKLTSLEVCDAGQRPICVVPAAWNRVFGVCRSATCDKQGGRSTTCFVVPFFFFPPPPLEDRPFGRRSTCHSRFIGRIIFKIDENEGATAGAAAPPHHRRAAGSNGSPPSALVSLVLVAGSIAKHSKKELIIGAPLPRSVTYDQHFAGLHIP